VYRQSRKRVRPPRDPLHKLVQLMQLIDRLVEKPVSIRNAIKSPTCIVPPSTARAPTQTDKHDSERADDIQRRVIDGPDAHHDSVAWRS
jgi:hypothetical protein